MKMHYLSQDIYLTVTPYNGYASLGIEKGFMYISLVFVNISSILIQDSQIPTVLLCFGP